MIPSTIARTVRRCTAAVAAALTAVALGATALAAQPAGAASDLPAAMPAGHGPLPAVAPYYFNDSRVDPPDPTTVMAATGVRAFTMSFITDNGGCEPRWYDPKGNRPLAGGSDERLIRSIRAHGGDVVLSFGGGDGVKLEMTCPDAASLAAAYRKVIHAYRLRAIDVDIEGRTYQDPNAQQRTIDALKLVHAAEPGVREYVTIPSDKTGPDATMVTRAAASHLTVDAWTIMPFDFGGVGQNMGALTVQATDGLKNRLVAAYGYGDREAYRHAGISSMNGITGAKETVTVADFRTMVQYARQHQLPRLTYWVISRDRPCKPNPGPETCSGMAQQPWDYTRVIVGYHGRG